MLKKVVIIGLASVLFLGPMIGCTSKERARNYGGTERIELKPGMKLEMVTWKENNLWIQTRPMRENEVAETHTFQEESSFGVLEGKILIIESIKQ